MSFEYTLASKDEARYNFIQTYFENTGTDMATMMVTSLTANCCIRILKVGDYITINEVKYEFAFDYTNLNYDTFVGLLNGVINGSGVACGLDYCNRIMLASQNVFTINNASYNVRLLMGLHPFNEIDIKNVTNYTIGTVGFMLSTPVLYLTSNIGQKCYKNVQQADNIQSMRIVMRINNSFSANYPINAGNAEFHVLVASNDLSNVEFMLVDANMMEINLLSPMYLSVSIKPGIVDEKILSLSNGVAETMHYIERMKNNEIERRDAELRNYSIMSTLDSQTLSNMYKPV